MKTKTYDKLKNYPVNNHPEYLIIHHTGGTDKYPLMDTSNHTAQIVEGWHLSKGWDGIGYHYFIEADGDVWYGRPEHRNGAHAIGYNTKSIGICLAGNFDATLPTKEQEESLRILLLDLSEEYGISKDKIVPHRKFASKSCFGILLDDNWASNLINIPDVKLPLHLEKASNDELLNELKKRLKS